MTTFSPWKILHLDLSQGVPDLAAEPEFQGLYIVYWWHNIPLGHQEILATQLPMSATQLTSVLVEAIAPAVGDRLLEQGFKATLPHLPLHLRDTTPPDLHTLLHLKQPLAQIEDDAPATSSSTTVSVVICTRDRPEHLVKCLRSLQASSQAPSEIVVVDNAPSSDATQQLVAEMPHVRYVLEPRPGLDIARNAGVLNSTGEIIAFTDDDVIVHPDWVMRLQQSFQEPKVMAVTGLVLAAALETEAQYLFEKYWAFNRGYRPMTYDTEYFEQLKPWGVPAWYVGAGANMAFRRQVFELIGGFDERLDVGASGCSGDSEFWYRVLAEGWHCHYEPTAIAYHYHRRDLDSLKRQIFYYMRGHVAALLIQFERYQHWGNLRRLLVSHPKFYSLLFVKGLLKGFQSRYSTLLPEVSGYFSGIKFYWQNRGSSRSHTLLTAHPTAYPTALPDSALPHSVLK
jgi:glycosyltransferase involved in cell wall biosynthesis